MQENKFFNFVFQKAYESSKIKMSQFQFLKGSFSNTIYVFADGINFQAIRDQNRKPHRKNNIFITSKT